MATIDISYSEFDSDADIGEDEKCIVCKRFSPDSSKRPCINIVQWGQNDRCNVWVHLVFCSPVRVIRKGEQFMWPKCDIAVIGSEQ